MWYHSPFDSLEYRRDGLLLTSCGLAGSAKHFLPRSQVDHISFGRYQSVGLILSSIILAVVGTILMLSGQNARGINPTAAIGIAILSLGCFFFFIALLLLMQRTLVIATVNGTFVSTKWCQADRLEELSNWLTGVASDDVYSPPAPMHVAHGNAYSSVALLQARA